MSYLSDICRPLVTTLMHLAELPAHQLAGHAANVDFWAAETKHGFEALAGYRQRFERLRDAQIEYVRQHGAGVDSRQELGFAWREKRPHPPPLRPSVPDSEIKQLRRQLSDAIYTFVARLVRESLISEEKVRDLSELLDIDLPA